ncbi:hypothetical protein KO500_00465 [Cellulophaga baltica]|uniref:hypothetical protein n=1 Tax=Cellulophaga TaxID=104264 RepID=UPI001C079B9C|nr:MULTISPECIES: hypothetical protein [Cellulophaga]MBU2994884.1 hypothetical protein [Cellulophaga baltica]MDO6766278.1 hypothetical protein [Cellulophaga sp. 1_MG-2023]
MKYLFTFLSLSLLSVSCGSGSVDLAIDNPTTEPVIIRVDSLEVEIPAEQVVWVEMGKGNHSLTLKNDSIVNFNFVSDVYMVNPTLTEYLMAGEYYGNNNSYAMYQMANTNTVEFLGIELEGDYAIVKDLINPITWDYGPRETLPETIQMESGASYEVLQKLFSPIEFIKLVSESRGTE